MLDKLIDLFRQTPPEGNLSPPVQTILDRIESGDISIERSTFPPKGFKGMYHLDFVLLRDEDVGEDYWIGQTHRSPLWWVSSERFLTQDECKVLFDAADSILTEREEKADKKARAVTEAEIAKERALLVEKYKALEIKEK